MNANPLPLYHKVYLLLKQRIEAGGFPADGPMPGEHALALEYGVSRLTIRRSLDALQADGLVERRQGRGTFVPAGALLARPQRSADMEALMTHLADMGMHTKVRLLEFARETAPAQVATQMGLSPDDAVYRAVRVRSFGKLPFSYLTIWVPEDIGARIDRRELASQPLLAILRGQGVEVAGAGQTISACLAEPPVAAALDIPIGAPLLHIRRLVRDRAGRVVEYLDALYRPDRYEYRMDMRTQETLGEPTWLPAGVPVTAEGDDAARH